MDRRASLIAGGLLAVIGGTWAGWALHSRQATVPATRSLVRVPVGEASGPSPQDEPEAQSAEDADAPIPVKIPAQLPAFSLSNAAGQPTSITSWAGKSLIINFWATWCAPCRHEIPLLQALSGEWRARNVEVVGIAVDYRDKVVAYANQMHITYPLLVGEDDALEAARALGVDSPAFPFTVFTDRRGEIVAVYVGELHKPQAELILSTVQLLDQDLTQLPAARHTIAAGLRSLRQAHPG